MNSSKRTTPTSAPRSSRKRRTGKASSRPKPDCACRHRPPSKARCQRSPRAWARQQRNSETLSRQLNCLQELLVSMLHRAGLPPLERDSQLISILVPVQMLSSKLATIRRKACLRLAQARYQKSSKGRRTNFEYDQSPLGRNRVRRYRAGETGRLTSHRYDKSQKGRERYRRYKHGQRKKD
jgi:hypothetical protein